MRANYQPSGGREEKTNGGGAGEADRGKDVSAEICKDQEMSLLWDRYFHEHKQQSETSSPREGDRRQLSVKQMCRQSVKYTQTHVQTQDLTLGMILIDFNLSLNEVDE